MTLPDGIDSLLLIAGGGGLLLGLLVGLMIGYVGRVKLRAMLDVRTAELAARASAESEREEALALASERMRASFGQLAGEQFRSFSETFLRLAGENLSVHQERAKGDLAARERAIENMMRPIRDALQRTDSQLQELEKARREAQGALQSQLEAVAAGHRELSVETRNLVSALRRPEVRGQWGEITLRRLVELAGMVEHCDFVSQSHQATEDGGSIRPDLLINLPEGRQLVVDVKTPLDAYLQAVQAEDEPSRRAAFARHATIVAERVRELAAKAYWSQFERSPEFVILFIPGDQFLSAALSQRPALLDDALRQNVILATPTSFVALLKAVAYGWQQVTLAENAIEIRQLGTQLYERLNAFAGHLLQIGKSLGDSVKAYNRGIGSLERMVLPGARRFTELGVKPRQTLSPLPPIEETPRESTISVEPETAQGAPTGGNAKVSADAEGAADGVESMTADVEETADGVESGTDDEETADGVERRTDDADGAADDESSAAERLAISTVSE